ncbi:reprolysin (M12B) family zinc metalloprotease domain-containing protein [Ditylenchus destructor]|nr:reprolysin (M12B) family zinc metalloprotease domain-containing protein [Ditylenchus destructor]
MKVMIFIFTVYSIWLVLLCDAKPSLRHTQTNKHFISQLDEGTFEIVHPFQVRDKKERIGIDTHNYFLNNTVHYKHVVIVIRSNTVAGVRLKLVLTLNEHILLNETQFRKLDENGESNVASPVENCYYQGTVNGDPASLVAISTCNGLWGIIAFENGTTLGIWPLDGGDRGRRHPHVLYRIKWNRDAACGAITQAPAQSLPLSTIMGHTSSLLKIKRDVTHQNKYLEVAIIGDYPFMKEFNYTESEALEFMLLSTNIADLIMARDLKIRLSVVYSEIWLDAQRVDLHNDVQQTLSGTIEYTTGHIYHVEKDATLMFTGGFFANSEMLTSSFSSICTARAVGLVRAVDAYAIHSSAQFFIHTLGHIIGIDDDSSECTCRNHNFPCIMNKQTGSIGSPFVWEFSKCSIARLHNVLQSEHVQCLLTRPFQKSRLHMCGNGIVDGDEECDCGRRDECLDPCCDPISCTLRSHAQCASHQPCCHRCELRQVGYVCREARSICDVPETCDGKSGDCPADGHLIDGVLCGIDGQCWKGNCSDTEQQCKDLWGPGARSAEEPCYSYNAKGVDYGNCGRDRNGQYISCSDENRKCGTLHCRDGNTLPTLSTLSSFNLNFVHESRQLQCKVVSGSESGLVQEGTRCASGKICIENSCIPLSQVSPPVHCPTNNLALQCSGHGDCTTTQKCLCYDGWSGVACDVRSNNSRRIGFATMHPPHADDLLFPTFKVGRTLETSTLLGILLLVGILLLLLLVCLLFCYRRKSSTELPDTRIHDKIDDESQDNTNRAIKFGQMPSYREEKRKRKKNKRVYDALQRINEAADERDSVSLKSSITATSNGAPAGKMAVQAAASHDGESYCFSNDSNRPDQQSFKVDGADDFSQYRRHASTRRLYGTTEGLELNFRDHVPVYAGSAHTLSPRSLTRRFDYLASPSHSDMCTGDPKRTIRGMRYPENGTGGYATDSELPMHQFSNTRIGEAHSSNMANGILSQSDSMDNCPMTPPLRLQSIQMLMKRLNTQEGNGEDSHTTDELELCGIGRGTNSGFNLSYMNPRQTNFGPPPEPPASADSGHPHSSGSPNGDVRDSPSLFSDAFKLDITSSN